MTKLLLFDVDNTLTESTKGIKKDMLICLENMVKKNYVLGIVGGSSIDKHLQQIGETKIFELFEYVFSQNGITAFMDGEEIHNNDIRNSLESEYIQEIINELLRILLDLPIKKVGNMISFRKGLIYFSPVGGDANAEEREQFIEYDKKNNVRNNIISILEKRFGDKMVISHGGSTGVCIHPIGWDKTYCLNHLDKTEFDEIHFFGDQTEPNGSDYTLYCHPDIIGHSVKSPEETLCILSSMIEN